MTRSYDLPRAVVSVVVVALAWTMPDGRWAAAAEPPPDVTGQATITIEAPRPLPAFAPETREVVFTNDRIAVALSLPLQHVSGTHALLSGTTDDHGTVEWAPTAR